MKSKTEYYVACHRGFKLKPSTIYMAFVKIPPKGFSEFETLSF